MAANQNVMGGVNDTALVWIALCSCGCEVESHFKGILPGLTLRSCNLTETVMLITALQYITSK